MNYNFKTSRFLCVLPSTAVDYNIISIDIDNTFIMNLIVGTMNLNKYVKSVYKLNLFILICKCFKKNCSLTYI